MDNQETQTPVSTSSTFWLSEADQSMLSSKANIGDKDAAFRLAQYYSFVEIDSDKERQWLECSARAGHALAQYNLSFILFNRENRDVNAALYWAEKARRNGEKKSEMLIDEIRSALK